MSSLADSSTAPTQCENKKSNSTNNTETNVKLVDITTTNNFLKELSFVESINTKKINALLKTDGILQVREEYIDGEPIKYDDQKSLKKILKRTSPYCPPLFLYNIIY